MTYNRIIWYIMGSFSDLSKPVKGLDDSTKHVQVGQVLAQRNRQLVLAGVDVDLAELARGREVAGTEDTMAE